MRHPVTLVENGSSHVFSGFCGSLCGVRDKLIGVTIPNPLTAFTLKPVVPNNKAEFIGTV
ncbi:hypothetical protein ATPR_3337 [Acetobacter tropicalis NBRC 101654]|uniref:Uncharacterized protein n=1 Tax=Acetobacter tropicalis NBRC 101654 TaxID=749388 RepID=F7VIY8_9PROT|nr:hypothetical protein ATPR_3337 [Acetobacter tropicalis NBRC 101654]